MVAVSGERRIDRLVESLLLASVRDVVVVLGYRADEVREHLTQTYGSTVRFTFVENTRYLTTNNICSLALALAHVGEDFVLIECDLFCDKSILRELVNCNWENAAVVARYRTGMDGTVVSVDAGRAHLDQVFSTNRWRR
jgi:choline kinase